MYEFVVSIKICEKGAHNISLSALAKCDRTSISHREEEYLLAEVFKFYVNIMYGNLNPQCIEDIAPMHFFYFVHRKSRPANAIEKKKIPTIQLDPKINLQQK